MGMDYCLYRVLRAIDGELTCDGSEAEPETLPFGTLEWVLGRLRPFISHEAPTSEPSRAADAIFRRSPGLAKSCDLSIDLDGRRFDVTLMGDPVTSLWVDHAVPWDLLPFAELLKTLAPLAIFDPQRNVMFDPGLVAPQDAHEVAPSLRPGTASLRDVRGMLALWRVDAKSRGSLYRAALLVAPRRLVVVQHGGIVTALDPSTGSVLWSVRCGRGRTFGCLDGDNVVVGSDHPQIFALRLEDGSTAWRARAHGRVGAVPVALPAGGVVVGTESGRVVRLTHEGEAAWSAAVEGPVYCAPVASREAVYVGTNEGALYALEPGAGTLLAERHLPVDRVNERTVAPRSVFGLVAVGADACVRFESSVVRFGQRLEPVAAASVPYGGGFDALVRVGDSLFSEMSWRPDDGALFRRGFCELALDLSSSSEWTGEGDLAVPVRLGTNLAFADAVRGSSDGRASVELSVLDAAGNAVASAVLEAPGMGGAAVVGGDAALYVGTSDTLHGLRRDASLSVFPDGQSMRRPSP